MSRYSSCFLVLLAFVVPNPSVLGEEQHYAVVAFDEHGRLDDGLGWGKLKQTIEDRSPTDVFLIAHGWRTSKEGAEALLAPIAKLLDQQKMKGESIEVLGIRWPSLIGEDDTVADASFRAAVALLSSKLGDSEKVKDVQAKMKQALKAGTITGALTRAAVARTLGFQLPDDDALGQIIDNLPDPRNIAAFLSVCSYYQMRSRAELVGVKGLRGCVTQLQTTLPKSRIHLVGHSFGCKVALAAIACDERKDRTVDSVTLLQAAVSSHCFAEAITEIEKAPAGGYVEVPRRVKGCLSLTFTENDKALKMAYTAASLSAGNVGDIDRRVWKANSDAYGALGAQGVRNVKGIPLHELGKAGTTYALQRGINAFNADKVIRSHGDVCREETAWLIWSTARYRP
jgi:hypothetical protein